MIGQALYHCAEKQLIVIHLHIPGVYGRAQLHT